MKLSCGIFARYRALRVWVVSALLFALMLSHAGCFLDEKLEPYYGRVVVPRAQEFHWSDGGLPQTFDPAFAAAPPDTDLVRAIFEGLTDYDPRSLTPVPARRDALGTFKQRSRLDVLPPRRCALVERRSGYCIRLCSFLASHDENRRPCAAHGPARQHRRLAKRKQLSRKSSHSKSSAGEIQRRPQLRIVLALRLFQIECCGFACAGRI